MLSPFKQPDPIYRNPSTQDEPDRKPLPGTIIGLSFHVVIVALIEHTRTYNGIKLKADKGHGHEVELMMAHTHSQVGVHKFNTNRMSSQWRKWAELIKPQLPTQLSGSHPLV